nr:unnamed protein product [Callosobruchus analis]
MLDKERYINQLINENRRLYEHYELVVSNIVDKDSLVTSLGKISERMEKIEKCPSNQNSNNEANPIIKPSFSDIVKNHQLPIKVRNESSEILVVKSNDKNSSSDDIMNELISTVNPAALTVCINKTQKTKTGVIIHCQDKTPWINFSIKLMNPLATSILQINKRR